MNRVRIRTISLIGLLVVAVAAFVYFGVIRKQPIDGAAIRAAAADKMPGMDMAKAGSPPAAPAAGQGGAVFVTPEKQQLIGMRSVPAEMGTLTKEIRLAGKVTYDETHLTHIHSKVSGYIEDVFADSVGKPVRAGDPLFTIYSPDLLATQQDFLLALKSRDLLRNSTFASPPMGSKNLIPPARARLRLWDVSDQEIDRKSVV